MAAADENALDLNISTVAENLNNEAPLPVDIQIRQIVEPLSPEDVKKLFSKLKLPKRPSPKKDQIDRICVIPVLDLLNSKNYVKTEAKKLNIAGTERQIHQELKLQNEVDILYRIRPHTAEQWHARIVETIREHHLGPITLEELAVPVEQQPEDSSSRSTAAVGRVQSTASQTNVGQPVLEYVTVANGMKTRMKEIRAVLQKPGSFDIDELVPLTAKINVVKETMEIVVVLAKECNIKQDDSLKELRTKLEKIEILYDKQEMKSRIAFENYMRNLDTHIFDSVQSVTDNEFAIIEIILKYVSAYEKIFGSEYPVDIELRIQSLRALSKKRPREDDDEVQQESQANKRHKGPFKVCCGVSSGR